jgi:hypothetical protein
MGTNGERKKLPWFPFFPGDWLKDPELRRCSQAVRGFFIDLLCLMFESECRGVLAMGGVPWSDSEVAEAVSGDPSANLMHLQELLEKGVLHRDEAGAIFSRRLVRDEKNRSQHRQRQNRYRGTRDASGDGECDAGVTGRSQKLEVRKKAAAETAAASFNLAAWEGIGLDHPVGEPAFREFWQTTWAGRNGAPLSRVMGGCADDWERAGGTVPGPFFAALKTIRGEEKAQADEIPLAEANL